MTTCLGKSCSFGLLCVSFVKFYQFLYVSFPFWFEGGMWYLIALLSFIKFVQMVAPHLVWLYSIGFWVSTIEIHRQYSNSSFLEPLGLGA